MEEKKFVNLKVEKNVGKLKKKFNKGLRKNEQDNLIQFSVNNMLQFHPKA